MSPPEPAEKWDGKYKGEPCDAGVFMYYLISALTLPTASTPTLSTALTRAETAAVEIAFFFAGMNVY
jgi:hypothetical protein